MPPQIEEVIVNTYLFDTEKFLPDCGYTALKCVARSLVVILQVRSVISLILTFGVFVIAGKLFISIYLRTTGLIYICSWFYPIAPTLEGVGWQRETLAALVSMQL